ncbi:MAG: DnaA N-terminal domain-containing protein [Anaerolineales bacterium]|jgi:hypothetical protein
MKPKHAWEAALGQLKMEMPKAAYDTWVSEAELVSYENGTFIIGLGNTFARDWLENRLSSTVSRLLTGMMNRSVETHFIVWDGAPSRAPEAQTESDPEGLQFKIRVAHQSLKDAITEPHKVVVIPGYFRRWIPFLGPTLAWIVVAFRQVMYLSTRHKAKPNAVFRASPQQVAHWAGIARNTLWRNMKDHRLRWFLERRDPDKHVYEFIATLPLTPGDAQRLRDFLIAHNVQSDPLAAIEAAQNTPTSQIWPNPPPPPKDEHLEMEPTPRSVQDVVFGACGPIKTTIYQQVSEAAEHLAAHLMPPQDVIIVSHYFMLNWVKRLGTAPAWFIALLRDQCFVSKGEARNKVWVTGGHAEIARMLGLQRPKTISEWLTPLEDSRFERPPRPSPRSKEQKTREERIRRREAKRNQIKQFVERIEYLNLSDNTAWQFQVNLVEPLIPKDQVKYDTAMALIEAFIATENLSLLKELLTDGGANGTKEGAFGTGEGANETSSSEVEARLIQVEARLEQTQGALGTEEGANGTEQGRVWNALSSLKHLKVPILNLLNHLDGLSTDLSTSTLNSKVRKRPLADIDSQNLVVLENFPDEWDLEELLSYSQLHPGTRQKLLGWDIDPWVLISHMLYAHSRLATEIRDPLALVGSTILKDPQRGFGGYFDLLAQLRPKDLAELIARSYDYAVRYPLEYQSSWKSGNQAWDAAMGQAKAEQLVALAARLGITANQS